MSAFLAVWAQFLRCVDFLAQRFTELVTMVA